MRVPADHLAQQDHRGRKNDQRDGEQQRVLHRHHDDEPEQSEEITPRGRDEQIENLVCGVGARVQARGELGRMAVDEVTEVFAQQL
jgi:hypothetical protein